MINSTSSANGAGGSNPISLNLNQQPATILPAQDGDTVSTFNSDLLTNALNHQPEARPEVVARGKLLAADPNYPPRAVIDHVAGLIVNSPDLSEDQS